MMEEFYKKKIIRDFLSLFSESKWKELLFLSIEYGIISLKRNYNVAALSLDDLSNIVDELKEDEIKRLKQNLKKYEINSNKEKSILLKPSSEWRKGDQLKQENRNRNHNHTQHTHKREYENATEKFLYDPYSKFEKENKIKYSLSSNIYPKWWGDLKQVPEDPRSRFNKSRKNQLKLKQHRKSYNYRSASRTKSYQDERNANHVNNINRNFYQINNLNQTDYQGYNQGTSDIPRSASYDTPYRGLEYTYNKSRLNINQVESKIKTRVNADKKIFNLLNKNNSSNKIQDNYNNHSSREEINNINEKAEDNIDNIDNIDNVIDLDVAYKKKEITGDDNYYNNKLDSNKNNNKFSMRFRNNYIDERQESDHTDNSKRIIENDSILNMNENIQYIKDNSNTDNKVFNESCSESYKTTNTPRITKDSLKPSNFTIHQPIDSKNSIQFYKYNNINQDVESQSRHSLTNSEVTESSARQKYRSNYIIEFDKRLNPQLIKERNYQNQHQRINKTDYENYLEIRKSNHNTNKNKNNLQTESSNLLIPKEGIVSFNSDNSNCINNKHRIISYDGTPNSQSSNRTYEDAINPKETVQNFLIKNNNNENKIETEINDTYKLSVTNTHNTDVEMNSQYFKNNLQSGRSEIQTENTEMNFLSSLRLKHDSNQVSPHFNKIGTEITNTDRKDNPTDLNYSKSTYNYAENNLICRNNDYEENDRIYKKNLRNIVNDQYVDLNDSCKLSSYAPSERTKMFYKKDVKVNHKQKNNSETDNSGYVSLNSSYYNNQKNYHNMDLQTFRKEEYDRMEYDGRLNLNYNEKNIGNKNIYENKKNINKSNSLQDDYKYVFMNPSIHKNDKFRENDLNRSESYNSVQLREDNLTDR